MTWLKITDPTTNEIVAGAKWMIWPSSSPTTQDELETKTLGAAVGSGKGKTRWPDKVDVNWILPEEKGMNAGAGSDDRLCSFSFLPLLLFLPLSLQNLSPILSLPSPSHLDFIFIPQDFLSTPRPSDCSHIYTETKLIYRPNSKWSTLSGSWKNSSADEESASKAQPCCSTCVSAHPRITAVVPGSSSWSGGQQELMKCVSFRSFSFPNSSSSFSPPPPSFSTPKSPSLSMFPPAIKTKSNPKR